MGKDRQTCRADCRTGKPWTGPRPCGDDIYACCYPLGHDGPHQEPFWTRKD